MHPLGGLSVTTLLPILPEHIPHYLALLGHGLVRWIKPGVEIKQVVSVSPWFFVFVPSNSLAVTISSPTCNLSGWSRHTSSPVLSMARGPHDSVPPDYSSVGGRGYTHAS